MGNIVFKFNKGKKDAYIFIYENASDIVLKYIYYSLLDIWKFKYQINLKNDYLFIYNNSVNLTYYFVIISDYYDSINDIFYIYNPVIPYMLKKEEQYLLSYQTDLISDSYLFYINNTNDSKLIYFHYQWSNLNSNLSIKIFNSTYEKEDTNQYIKKVGYLEIE